MKTTIFNRGKGWYVSGTNYKNKEDKAYMSVHFTKDCGEPTAFMNEQGYARMDIDVLESFYSSYNNKMEWIIQKYTGVQNVVQSEQKARQNEVVIEQQDLPFY